MARYDTVNDIINTAAVEVGLAPVTDPVAASDEAFMLLQGLLDAAGRELVLLHDWQVLRRRFQFTTAEGDTGTYDLPDDFSHMIDQTGWDRTNGVPLGGPMSAQAWTWLEGRDVVSQTVYAGFRLAEGKLDLYPQPPPVGLDIAFEYIGRNWIREQGAAEPNRDRSGTGSDIVMLDPLLMTKFIICKWKFSKGFPASDSKVDFENMFNSLTGKDEGMPILSTGGRGRGVHYLSGYSNVGDTGFGA